jgi:hypothetical protein
LSVFANFNSPLQKLAITTQGNIFGHAAAAGAIAVGAVDVAQGPTFDGGETTSVYSADGPRRVFFNADGTAITPGNFSSTGGTLRQKPDFVAAAGVATATPGFNPFYGSSAAAPHAAAIAAQALDAVGNTPNTRAAIEYSTIDIETFGFDVTSGWGILSGFDAPDFGAAPLAGTPIVSGSNSGLFAMRQTGSPLQRLKPNNASALITYPSLLGPLVIKGGTLYSASQTSGSVTEVWKTDLYLNRAGVLATTPDPDLNTVKDFAFVGNALYAAAATPWPTGSQPPCSTTLGRIVAIDQLTGVGTNLTVGGDLCDPSDMAVAGGQIFVSEPNWPGQTPGTNGPGAILKIDPSTGAQSVFSQGGVSMFNPIAITKLPSGDLAVIAATSAAETQWRLLHVNATSGAQTVVGNLGASPRQIAAEASGSVLVAYDTAGIERVSMANGQRTVLLATATNLKDIEVVPQGSGGPACGLGAEICVVLAMMVVARRRTSFAHISRAVE